MGQGAPAGEHRLVGLRAPPVAQHSWSVQSLQVLKPLLDHLVRFVLNAQVAPLAHPLVDLVGGGELVERVKVGHVVFLLARRLGVGVVRHGCCPRRVV